MQSGQYTGGGVIVTIQASVSKGWLHEVTGATFGDDYYFDPLKRRNQDLMVAEFLEQTFPRYRIHNLESNLVSLSHYSPSHLYVGGIQPNLILGMLLGANFVAYPHQDADISGAPLAGLSSISDLPDPQSLRDAPLIREWSREIALLRRTQSDAVIPPFFWDTSGRATIHGHITTALKLFGQDILLLVHDDPDFLASFYKWYGDVCVVLIETFASAADIPIRSLHIGECSATMLGPREYRDSLIPQMESLAERIAPLRLHHCGDCTYLLREIASINGLRALDTGSGTSVSEIRRTLGFRFPLDLMPPVELLVAGPEAARIESWVNTVLSENRDGPLCLNYHLEPGYDPCSHLLLHDALYARGVVHPARM